MVNHDYAVVHFGGHPDCIETLPENGHWIVFYRLDLVYPVHCTSLLLRDVKKEDGAAKALIAARTWNKSVSMCERCYDYGGKES